MATRTKNNQKVKENKVNLNQIFEAKKTKSKILSVETPPDLKEKVSQLAILLENQKQIQGEIAVLKQELQDFFWSLYEKYKQSVRLNGILSVIFKNYFISNSQEPPVEYKHLFDETYKITATLNPTEFSILKEILETNPKTQKILGKLKGKVNYSPKDLETWLSLPPELKSQYQPYQPSLEL